MSARPDVSGDAFDSSMSVDSRPMIGVLALQGAFAAHEDALASLGCSTRRVRTTEDLFGLDGLVLPGGESTTMSKLLLSRGLFDAVSCAIDSGVPVFGTCAGMILLASSISDGRDDQVVFGAIDMSVRRNAYGRQIDSFETNLEVEGVSHPVPALFIRAPGVESTGPTVEVLARVDGRPCLVRQGRVWAASFHPELTSDRAVHSLFVECVRAWMAERIIPRSDSSADDQPVGQSVRSSTSQE